MKIVHFISEHMVMVILIVIAAAVIVGIVQYIRIRIRNRKKEYGNLHVIQPMDYFGIAPTTGRIFKHNFTADEEEEKLMKKYSK
jgi:hypothetical protein